MLCVNWGMSKRSGRVHDAPGYILHATAWRETSLILQVFTRHYGISALIAKGAKRPYSALRATLVPFQPVLFDWSGAGEVRTLIRAELAGHLPMQGKAIMSAWYLNELALHMLARDDPHPNVFDAYHQALNSLAAGSLVVPALRRYEWVLLRETGYGFDEPEPDFNNLAREPALRMQLRERLAQVLERPLRTRTLLMELQQL